MTDGERQKAPGGGAAAELSPTVPATSSAIIHRKAACACGGGCPACRSDSGLRVSQPGDAAEIEADSVADRVMRMPVAATPTRPSDSIEEAEEERAPLQMKAGNVSGDAPPEEGPGSVKKAVLAGGSPLDRESRAFFEPRFGVDLGHVRIHTDAAAMQSARLLNARAYTLGNDIVFGSGEFDARSDSGKRLLAHELAHVGQQRSGQGKASIQRQPNPAPDPTVKPPGKEAIGITVFLDKDCRGMGDAEFSDYALVLFFVQTFGLDKTKAGEIIQSISGHWTGPLTLEKDKRLAGARISAGITKSTFRSVMVKIYGSDAPFIDSVTEQLFGAGGNATEREVKEAGKQNQLNLLTGKLSPLDLEYIKTHYKQGTGASLDKQLEDMRKIMADLESVKRDPVAWFKFLKTQMTPVAFYHKIAAEFKRLDSLFFHTIFSRALTAQYDPLNPYYKTYMAQLYKEYPWLKGAENDIKVEAAKFPSSASQMEALKQELNLNGFRDEAHYNEFAVMFVDAFRDVVVAKVEDQLKLSEEIVLKEKTRYSSGDLSGIQGLFKGYAEKLKYVQDERDKLNDGKPPYDEIAARGGSLRAYRAFEEREKEINGEISRVREAYSYAYPILADKKIDNSDLITADSAVLKAKLLSVTETRMGNITKTRENLKKNPEKFVYMVADQMYLRKAKEDLFIDVSSLEAFVIKGRIDKMGSDETLKNVALAALTIGIGLATLPFTGTAAALASIPGFALGIYSSVEEVQEYRMRMAAAGTSFSIKDSILKEEPGLFWLVVSLAGTALDGFIIGKTFATMAKSRYLKYGLPERKFLQELEETLLKEAAHLEPDKLKVLLKEVEKKVAETEELNAKFAKAAESLAAAAAKIAKTAAKADVALIDKLAESVYWAIRRGIKTSDEFLKEAKDLEKIDRALIDDCFKQLHAAMPGGKALSPSGFQNALLGIYKQNGHELVQIFVRNDKTNLGAFLTAIKKSDGKYEFLEMADMTDNAKTLVRDIELGDKNLRLAKNNPLKGVNFDQVRKVAIPTKVLSDLPEVQAILKAVEDLEKPLNDLKRQARKLREELEKLAGVAGADPTMVATKTQKLSDMQQAMSGQGKKLLAEADKLQKEAALVTDKAQKSHLLKQAESIKADANLLHYDIKVQDAFNRRSVLRDVLETAKKFGGNAMYYEAHHLIPVELIQESGVLRKAIEGGFDYNGLINGINLPQFSSKFRTQNIVVEMLENGSKARIIEDKVVREVVVEAAGEGKKVFKLNDKVVGELNYTRQLQPDGTFIEGGRISLKKDADVVSEALKESPFGVHASHPNYTSYVSSQLEKIEAKLGGVFTPQQARQEVEALVSMLRGKVESVGQTPGKTIDDLFKP